MTSRQCPVALVLSMSLAAAAHAQAAEARGGAFLIGMCVHSDSLDTRPYVEQPQRAAAQKRGMHLPPFPEALRRPGWEGTVVAAFVVEVDGHVRPGSVAIISSDDPLLSEWACRAVPTMELYPARDDGHPVAAQALLPFTYRGPRITPPADSVSQSPR
jgi:outer membrane biosynthesis protein TonB